MSNNHENIRDLVGKVVGLSNSQETLLLILKELSGTPGPIRTADLLLRRQTLYPAELRAHIWLASQLYTSPAAGQTCPMVRCFLPAFLHLAERWLSGRKQRFAKPS
jgi:hypothetical protein